MRQRFRFTIKLFIGLLFVIFGYFTWNLPNVSWLLIHNPTHTPFMDLQIDKFKAIKKDIIIKQTWINYTAIADSLKKSVLAAEDDTFFNHQGFNWNQIKKAYQFNKKSKKKHGASTITQQLAKNLYLGPERSLTRKIKEALITLELEHTLPKERILELYLNLIEWGPGVFGAESAANYYFKKSASALNNNESAKLAAMIPNPLKYSSPKYAGFLNRRANMIAIRARNQILGPAKQIQDNELENDDEEPPSDQDDNNDQNSSFIPEF